MACRLTFTSPLHRFYFLRKHYRGKQQTLRPDRGMAGLLVSILERMDPLVLQTSYGRGVQGQLLERAWQMEIYRAAAGLLPSDHWFAPDVGKGGRPASRAQRC